MTFQYAFAADLRGYWRFVDDGTLVQIDTCKSGVCGVVVGVAPSSPKNPKTPPCGFELLSSIVPRGSATEQHFEAAVADPESGKQYKATLRKSSSTAMTLTVRALGGLFSESYVLETSSASANNCPNHQKNTKESPK
jgi:uncharacterized protein (DUF2147 family)